MPIDKSLEINCVIHSSKEENELGNGRDYVISWKYIWSLLLPRSLPCWTKREVLQRERDGDSAPWLTFLKNASHHFIGVHSPWGYSFLTSAGHFILHKPLQCPMSNLMPTMCYEHFMSIHRGSVVTWKAKASVQGPVSKSKVAQTHQTLISKAFHTLGSSLEKRRWHQQSCRTMRTGKKPNNFTLRPQKDSLKIKITSQ